MPQNPVLVYSTEDRYAVLHAHGRCRRSRAPGRLHARAAGRTAGPGGPRLGDESLQDRPGRTHPELQTEEEKTEARRKANEEAAVFAGLPPGTPIVVQAPSERPASQAARQAGGAGSASPTGGECGGSASARARTAAGIVQLGREDPSMADLDATPGLPVSNSYTHDRPGHRLPHHAPAHSAMDGCQCA